MRSLIQRVTRAQISVEGEVVGSIGKGFLVLLGVGSEDDEQSCGRLWQKVRGLRIMDDGEGKMNLALSDVGGEVLVVSQFTLFADCRKGNRPSFTAAAGPEQGKRLYELFCELVRADLGHVETGIFGADMAVELVNDGPVTTWLDTDSLSR